MSDSAEEVDDETVQLITGCCFGDEREVASLLEYDLDVDAECKQERIRSNYFCYGCTAAMIASREGHDRCLKLVLGAGADVDLRSNSGSDDVRE